MPETLRLSRQECVCPDYGRLCNACETIQAPSIDNDAARRLPFDLFQIYQNLIEMTDRKIEALRVRADTDPRLRDKLIVVGKTAKVIEHKVAALKEHGKERELDRLSIARGLDRAINAAKLLNIQLDDLLTEAAKNA
jgi:hypothetical protein